MTERCVHPNCIAYGEKFSINYNGYSGYLDLEKFIRVWPDGCYMYKSGDVFFYCEATG